MVRDDFDTTYNYLGGAVIGESTEVTCSITEDAHEETSIQIKP